MNMVRQLAQHPDISGTPISGIDGIETWRDVVEYILLGATSVQVCTAVMHYGFGIVREMDKGLRRFMDERGFETIYDFAGKALPNIVEWKELNMSYKVVASINPAKCIGCQLCYIACEDGAHQAISVSSDPANRIPSIIEENCVGCNLCSLVCPVEACITMEKQPAKVAPVTWEQLTETGNIPTTFNDPRAGGNGHHVPEPTAAIKR